MRQARIKVRVKRIKLDGLTFDQQVERWRAVLNDDTGATRHLLGGWQFGDWAIANLEALTKLRYERWRI